MEDDFDKMAERFTQSCKNAASWKHVQFGAAHSSRIIAAIADLKAAIAAAEAHPEIGHVEIV